MKKKLTIFLLLFIAIGTLNAKSLTSNNKGQKYGDLTSEYFYGKNSKVSVDVRRVVASDPETSPNTLKILSNDDDFAVWLLVRNNLG